MVISDDWELREPAPRKFIICNECDERFEVENFNQSKFIVEHGMKTGHTRFRTEVI